MKLVKFASIAVASLLSVANAATSYTFTEPSNIIEGFYNAFSGFSSAFASEYLYRGVILGLQEDSTDTDHQCYLSYLTLETFALGLPDYLTAL
jgi:hypothetical protein